MIDPKQFATELRIGNWLNPAEPEYKGKYFQIDAGDIKHIRDGMRTYKYEPIPLSGEVLLACGFQERNYTIYINVCTGLSLEFDEDNHVVIVHWDEIVFDLNEQVKSLHQLQNLYFSLTGKELVYSPSKINSNGK